MSLYKQKFNPVSGQFNLVPLSSNGIVFKTPVATATELPLTGNTLNDARITSDTGHLYIWDGTSWINQGNVIDVTWESISNKPNLIESSVNGDWKLVTSIQYNHITGQIKVLYEI